MYFSLLNFPDGSDFEEIVSPNFITLDTTESGIIRNCFNVQIFADIASEGNESFLLQLAFDNPADAVGVRIEQNTTEIFILDYDGKCGSANS